MQAADGGFQARGGSDSREKWVAIHAYSVGSFFHVALATVGKWRQRFVLLRLDGLLDEPRPGTPRRLSDAAVERVLARTLETQPQAATHWSTRSLAQATGLSQSSISRIWRAFSLQPHRSQAFKLSRDPLFIDKVRDIVGLYLNPPDRALVLVRSAVSSEPERAAASTGRR